MNAASILAYSITDYFSDVFRELTHFFSHMNMTQWGIVASCAVAFGFLCLKGTGINR